MIIGRNQVMEKSNLTSRFDNHDYDGDSLIALALHSEQARKDFKYAYVKNIVEFEHMDELLIDFEHESIFSAYMLTLKAKEDSENWVAQDFPDLFDENFTIQQFQKAPGKLLKYSNFDKSLTRVEAAINYILLKDLKQFYTQKDIEEFSLNPIAQFFKYKTPIYSIEEDGLLTKKNLMKLTEKFWKLLKEAEEYHKIKMPFWDIIHELDKFLLECSGSISYCTPSFDLKDFVVQDPEIDSYKENLISAEPFVAFHQNMLLFKKVSEKIQENPNNILNLVFQSGARLKSVQLLKAASNTGIPTDIYGKAFPANIKSSLLDGLTPEEYFTTSDSARLALAVRQEAIPKGGELQRKFFFTTGILKLDKEKEECQSEKEIPLEEHKTFPITIKSWEHLKLLNHRWYIDEHPSIPGEKSVFIIETDSQDDNVIESHKELIGRTLNFYSPITCKHEDYKICKRCFGEKQPSSANLGSTVGAALSEGIIQSVLRAHHFGGAFIAHEDKQLLTALEQCEFKAPDTIISDNKDDIEIITNYLEKIYSQEEIDFEITEDKEKIYLKLIVHELPFNDDSVKALNNIVGLIDKNRDSSSMISPVELYEQLQHVIEENGILSVYLELIISLLYYDEDGVLYRYTEKELAYQTALKNIIEILDPKLSIFYNFSNRIISKIYNHKSTGHIDHMYRDLLEVYQ